MQKKLKAFLLLCRRSFIGRPGRQAHCPLSHFSIPNHYDQSTRKRQFSPQPVVIYKNLNGSLCIRMCPLLGARRFRLCFQRKLSGQYRIFVRCPPVSCPLSTCPQKASFFCYRSGVRKQFINASDDCSLQLFDHYSAVHPQSILYVRRPVTVPPGVRYGSHRLRERPVQFLRINAQAGCISLNHVQPGQQRLVAFLCKLQLPA